MSNILQRLARLARAEINHVRAVIADRDDNPAEDERQRRLDRLRRAREELARAEEELRRVQREQGASAWEGDETGAADGAAAWGQAEAPPRGAANPWGRGPEVFSQEVRLAYAALEIPLGSDRETVQRSYRELLSRYHPDRHARDPKLERAANELTRRIREARDTVLAYLDATGG